MQVPASRLREFTGSGSANQSGQRITRFAVSLQIVTAGTRMDARCLRHC
jgi:hypothetical protein